MADHSNEGSSSSITPGESATSIVELNIKTLDSHIYSFEANTEMLVLSFKHKIAREIGIPVNQQRLIFRGKVLKDEHPLSEYHLENGHTLHLVERQPIQNQAASDNSTGDSTGNVPNEAGSTAPRNRVGQIAHSVVLGTFNVGDQGEGVVPDLSRVIGAVLNSIGINNQNAINGATSMQSTLPNNHGAASQGNETFRVNMGGGGQAAHQAQIAQAFQPMQTFPHIIQIPLASAAVSVPSLHTPLPDSLTTMSEFMNRMEHAISQTGGNAPRVELPSNAQGLPTPETLSIVLRHVQRVLSDHAISSLSRMAERLEQEGSSTDPAVRGQIQEDSVQVGLRMQHLGALLLELGRTILTLRMGQSSAESVVNAGPAVYISPTGPNPIMVQPFPLQANSLLGGSVLPSNPVAVGAVGIGTAPRHINIHIHAVGSRTSNGEGAPAERDSVNVSTDSADVNSQIRDLAGNFEVGRSVGPVQHSSVDSGAGIEQRSTMKGGTGGESSQSLPGSNSESGSEKIVNNAVNVGQDTGEVVNSSDLSTSSSGRNDENIESNVHNSQSQRSCEKSSESGSAQAVPLGLGLGGLERRRRGRQQNSQGKGADSGTSLDSIDQTQQLRTGGQNLFQSLASTASMRSSGYEPSSELQTTANPTVDARPLRGPGLNDQIDLASSMSQVLQNPALNGLLTGLSEQTGVGSPDVLRNMMQQLTQSPQMRNAVNQIAQQVDTQSIENMLSGSGRGQGGGINFSGMLQQMMPVVSQVLGGGLRQPPSSNLVTQPRPLNERVGTGLETPTDLNYQNGLEELARRILSADSPRDVFQAVVQSSTQFSGSREDIASELCNDERLVEEYLDLLSSDVNRRFRGK